MNTAVEVLLDRLACSGDWRTLVHTVLTRARKQYAPADLRTAILDWVLREDLPAVLEARGHADAAARVRSMGAAFDAADVAARRDARRAMLGLLPEITKSLRASDPVAAEACVRAERCASYGELHPVGNNLRHYLSWVENEAERSASTLRLFATLAGDAAQGKSAVLIHLTTGEAVALWVTLRGPKGELADNAQRLRERVPPEIAAEVGLVDPQGEPARGFAAVTPAHVLRMVLLRHVACSLGQLRADTGTAFLRGGVASGTSFYRGRGGPDCVVGWNEHGVVGLSFERSAPRGELGVAREADEAAALFETIPAPLEAPATAVRETAARFVRPAHLHRVASAFWITSVARRCAGATAKPDREPIDALFGSAREALDGAAGWRELCSLTPEQGELAWRLAQRAAAGGGDLTDEETDVVLAIAPDADDKYRFALSLEAAETARADLGKVGLAWNVPRARIEAEKSALRAERPPSSAPEVEAPEAPASHSRGVRARSSATRRNTRQASPLSRPAAPSQ